MLIGLALIIALLLSAYSYFYGPLKWAEDSDVFALMEQWIFHPIGRQVHKVYPIYEDPEALDWEEWIYGFKPDLASEEPFELELVRDFYFEPSWDFPSFKPVGRPYDYEWDGL